MKKQLSVFNYSIKNAAESNTLDIYIDGEIVDAEEQEFIKEYWGDTTSVSYKSLRDAISASDAKTINTYINSPGGHVGDAMAIHDLFVDLQTKGYTINSYIRGICASSATYIAMSTPNSYISDNSMGMVHNVSGGVYGSVDEVENYAKAMRKFNDLVTDFYVKKTGLSKDEVTDLMKNETWLNAQEMVDKKFIANKTASVNFTNQINPDHWLFKNTEVLKVYNSFTQNNSAMDLKKVETAIENGIKNMLEKLGISNKSTEATSKEAVKDFTDAVVNTIKEAIPTEESIQTMVDNALQKTSDADALAIENAIKAGTKDFVNKATLETEIKNLSKELAKNLGNETTTEEKPKNKGGKNSRFANKKWFDGE